MSEFSGKNILNSLNLLMYENFIWKSKYNELWQTYQLLQNELDCMKSEYNNINNEFDMNGPENSSENPKIISHLQNKTSELIKTIMNKNKEITELKSILNKPPM